MRRRLVLCVGALFIAATAIPGAPAGAEADTLGFTVSPGAGPPGTRVHFEGDVPVDANDFSNYQQPNFAYGLSLVQEDVPTLPDCNLIVSIEDQNQTVTDDGHVTGSFVVGHEGGCFMSDTDLGPQRPRPGVYAILLSCHACTPIGTFHITSEPLARTGYPIAPLVAAGGGLVAAGLSFVALSRRRRSG